jgi:thiol-disulfide isomerase/thioredoxin
MQLRSRRQISEAKTTNRTRRRSSFAVLVFLTVISLWLTQTVTNADDIERPASFQAIPGRLYVPPIQLMNAEGEPTALSKWHGKLVVLNVWATWCAPCVAEMPALDRLAERLGDGGAVLAVGVDRGGPPIGLPFLEKLGISHLIRLFDPANKIQQHLAVRGLPTTFIIDANGLLIGRIEGAIEWDTQKIISWLRSLRNMNEP